MDSYVYGGGANCTPNLHYTGRSPVLRQCPCHLNLPCHLCVKEGCEACMLLKHVLHDLCWAGDLVVVEVALTSKARRSCRGCLAALQEHPAQM